jgi:hypothetical protein
MSDEYNPEGMTDEEFASFCEIKTEEGAIPAGRTDYVTGKVLFRSGAGYLLTPEQYAKKYGFDPEPVWERLKAFQKKTGRFIEPVELGYIKPARRAPVKLGRY